jgi:hypothetical protein
MSFLFIDRVGLFEHVIIIKNVLPNGSRRSKERRVSSTPIPTAISPQPQQLQNFPSFLQHSHPQQQQPRNFPLSNSSLTATAVAATAFFLFPTAVSLQQR